MESVKKFKAMKEELGMDVEFEQDGYLFLAHSEEMERIYKELIKLQRSMELDVEYVDVATIKEIVPGINTEGLLGGVYCPSDGQANPFLVVDGYARKIKERGRIFTHCEVKRINIQSHRVVSITTAQNETLYAPIVVNATGPFIREFSMHLGLDILVFPERHESLITEPIEIFFKPMIVDYRPDGCYFHQKAKQGSIIGCYTPAPNVPGKDVSSSFEFLREMGRRMARLIPKLAGVKIIRQWAGSYEMTPDGNPIIDKTDIEGLWIIGGFCGHGFMLGPEIGYIASEYITTGKTPYDIKEFALKRDFSRKEVMK